MLILPKYLLYIYLCNVMFVFLQNTETYVTKHNIQLKKSISLTLFIILSISQHINH